MSEVHDVSSFETKDSFKGSDTAQIEVKTAPNGFRDVHFTMSINGQEYWVDANVLRVPVKDVELVKQLLTLLWSKMGVGDIAGS